MRILTRAFGILAATTLVAAAADAPAPRPLTLQESVAMALEKNLELRIERYNPQFALYNLGMARAGYEPNFGFTGRYNHNESGSQLLTGGFSVPGSTADQDIFSSSLTGLTPWGMTYGLAAAANEQTGQSFNLNTNLLIVGTPFASSQSSVSVDLVQPLLKNFWIDGTRLNIAVAKNRVKYSDLGLKGRIMDIVTRVELAYYDLEYGLQAVKVQEKAVELAQRLLAENRKRVEVGALAPLDEKQAESEAAAREVDLLVANRNLDVLENALKKLLSDNFAGWSSESLEPTDRFEVERPLANVQDSWSKGLAQRPEYLQAKLDLERDGIQLKYDRNQLYPQLDAFASLGYNGSGVGFSDSLNEVSQQDRPFYGYGGRISLPLGNGAARNRYKSTKAGIEQSVLGLKKLEQDIMIEIDNAIKLAQSNYERVNASRKAVEYAEAALAAEQKKLENGKSTSFVVLQLQRDLTSVRSDEINSLVQYKRSLALLAQAEGSTLERRKIDLTVK